MIKRNRKEEKSLVLALIISLVVSLCCGCYLNEPVNQYKGIIRFHVIANSDTVADQKLKLAVRDSLVPVMQKKINDEAEAEGKKVTYALTRDYIRKNIGRIENMAKAEIAKRGFDYSVQTKLGVTYIPQKAYGSIVFPAGNYEALNITIGEGKGHNWFCVLFPPLCLVESGSEKALHCKWKILELLYR